MGSHGRLLVLEEPLGCCMEDVSEKAGLQEEQAVHGLRSERARLAWGSGVQRGDGEERFRGEMDRSLRWTSRVRGRRALRGSSLPARGQFAGLVVVGVIVHGVGSSGGSLVVCKENDLSHFGHDDFEVPWDIPEQCLGG